ncbi:MAG: hypothetical protein ACREQX_09465 [Candidatus Binataceae bacterium]
MLIEAMGRSTCLQKGKIVNTHFDMTINGEIGFHGQYLANIHPQEGDSGEVWWTQSTCPQAVALGFAGTTNTHMAVGSPIGLVLSGLNVTLVGQCCGATLAVAAYEIAARAPFRETTVRKANRLNTERMLDLYAPDFVGQMPEVWGMGAGLDNNGASEVMV